MASVTFRHTSVTYPDGSLGLADIGLEVREGEFMALIGPSGSGKTTLLRTLAGFITPSQGEVLIGDEVVAAPGRSVPVERRGLGMVFQQHAVWPHMSVEQNIAYPLKLAGAGRAERRARVAEVLELVGLGGFGSRRPSQLSGGQRQRVALARAIVRKPRVLLLDEALSALDEPLRADLRAQLQAMSKQLGLTVVHVTHDRSEALAIADRIAVLDGGRLQQIGAPDELIERPASPFVARFLGDATLLRGRLENGLFHAEQVPLAVPAARITPGAPDSTQASMDVTSASGPASRGPASSSSAADGPVNRNAPLTGLLAVRPEQFRLTAVEGSPADDAAGETPAGTSPVNGGADNTPSGGNAADHLTNAPSSRDASTATGPGARVTSGDDDPPPALIPASAPARVLSSLYGRHSCSARIEWSGLEFSCETALWRPQPGQAVRVDVTAGTFYPLSAAGSTPAARQEGEHAA
ncbi:ABC transporter ATP-binding protein [Sediminivirga luteola]|uniref:ABC transporter ATP-binding protein n=1 Tax=Sediminivirga luteola TaxID=1774748 RepID=UPI001F5916EE|nr:ABC transporter ATP-binding protein [Sediminivirga luteola]MCI2266267.1 ATP-binding cassette domain-containing protein [Sediminivirga luteola]